ncbi:MAG: TetR family transcriptional regulator [Oscillospiraceae bacterium]|nr:TetR family transcriptional regulator [Oscillospiraceae bacterium]
MTHLLLDSARRHASREGMSKTTVDDLAADAKISKQGTCLLLGEPR